MKLETTNGFPLLGKSTGEDFSLPGYRIYEYLLVLNPPEELQHKIMKVRQAFGTKYKMAVATSTKPFVVLVNFLQYGMMEERLCQRLKAVAMIRHPIKVELKDYGAFPSHTIFINIISKKAIQTLVKTIREEAQRFMKLNADNKPHFIMEPHIILARQLQPWQYEKGWLEYAHQSFAGRFIAEAMLLLKRPVGEKPYQRVAQFDFENLPVNTVQGKLFG
jgi:2'-5' RNA ligase